METTGIQRRVFTLYTMASFNTVDKLGDENQTPLVSGIFVDLDEVSYLILPG